MPSTRYITIYRFEYKNLFNNTIDVKFVFNRYLTHCGVRLDKTAIADLLAYTAKSL